MGFARQLKMSRSARQNSSQRVGGYSRAAAHSAVCFNLVDLPHIIRRLCPKQLIVALYAFAATRNRISSSLDVAIRREALAKPS
jgi:hypothetical protein